MNWSLFRRRRRMGEKSCGASLSYLGMSWKFIECKYIKGLQDNLKPRRRKHKFLPKLRYKCTKNTRRYIQVARDGQYEITK